MFHRTGAVPIECGGFRSRGRARAENAFDFRQVAAHGCGVNVALDDFGMLLQDARGIFPFRGMVVVVAIPRLSAGPRAVSQARMLEELRQTCFVTAVGDGIALESGRQRGPVLQAVLSGERMLLADVGNRVNQPGSVRLLRFSAVAATGQNRRAVLY